MQRLQGRHVVGAVEQLSDALLALLLLLPPLRPKCILVTGRTGCGKSRACRDAFVRAGARVIAWDPVQTPGFRVPSLMVEQRLGSGRQLVVIYGDDVDVAARTQKGGWTMLASSLEELSSRESDGSGSVLIMTAGAVEEDRMVASIARLPVVTHVTLTPLLDAETRPAATATTNEDEDEDEEKDYDGFDGGAGFPSTGPGTSRRAIEAAAAALMVEWAATRDDGHAITDAMRPVASELGSLVRKLYFSRV